MRKHIVSLLHIMALFLLFCTPMAGAEDNPIYTHMPSAGGNPKSPHVPGAAQTPVDRKIEINLAQGQMWANLIYLKAGREYKFSASGDTNVRTIGLYVKKPHTECMEMQHRRGMMENENNVIGTNQAGMMETGDNMLGSKMGDKEAKILMQSIGDSPALCFTPDADGHYKFKTVLQTLSPDTQYGKVTITIKEGCSPSLF